MITSYIKSVVEHIGMMKEATEFAMSAVWFYRWINMPEKRGEFCYLKHTCMHCGQEIPLDPKYIDQYEFRGYPRFLKGHWNYGSRNVSKRPDVKEKLHNIMTGRECTWSKGKKREDFSSYLREHNPMWDSVSKEKWFAKRIYKILLEEYKVKVAVEKLEARRLEIIAKEPKKVEKQEPLKINPTKMWILCPITGKKVKSCFKKHCKEYDFCHTMRKSNVKSIQSEVEEAYSSKIKQLSGKYCEV